MKKTVYFLLFAAFILLGLSPIHAQDEVKEHPIDAAINACFNEKPSTLGVIECHLMGYQKWSAEVDRLYKELLGKLADDETKNSLKEQQAAWVNMRDLQFEFNNKFYEIYKGAGSITLIASSKTDFARRRALELQSYIDELGGQ